MARVGTVCMEGAVLSCVIIRVMASSLLRTVVMHTECSHVAEMLPRALLCECPSHLGLWIRGLEERSATCEFGWCTLAVWGTQPTT